MHSHYLCNTRYSISLHGLHGVFKDRRHPKISIQCLSEISHVQFVNLMTLYFIRILPLSTFLSQYISYSLNILKQLKCKTNSLWHAVMKRSDKVRVMSIFLYNVSQLNTRFENNYCFLFLIEWLNRVDSIMWFPMLNQITILWND